MSEFIGVVRNAETGVVMMVINPDDDAELDNPRWLLLKTSPTIAVEMIKVRRGDYMGAMTMAELSELVERMKP
jgi:hypothetical protein